MSLPINSGDREFWRNSAPYGVSILNSSTVAPAEAGAQLTSPQHAAAASGGYHDGSLPVQG